MCMTVLTICYTLRKVRKNQMKIGDSIFWIYMPIILFLFCLFPKVAQNISKLIGIESTVNFIFLVIIFCLLIKMFLLSVKISILEHKFEEAISQYAIDRFKIENSGGKKDA